MNLAVRATRALLALGFVTALLVGFSPAAPAEASTPRNLELDVLALVNVERAQAGLGALTERTDIRTVARNHSTTMANQSRLHHNPDFGTQITGWQRVSENVGTGPSVASIHRALMNSDGHRRNIMDDRVTEMGIGVVVRDGRVWVTQNFRRPSGTVTTSRPSSRTYGDVISGSTHATAIDRVGSRGIADDCGLARYCPSSPVTRGEFATMLVRTLNLPRPSSTTSRFRDVSGEQGRDVEALAAAGLTTGCDTNRFCPNDRLTRAQQASFFARALGLSPVTSPFSDVGRTHGGAVGALARAGIVNGCSPGRYCPNDLVTRAQTASMIDRNLR